MCCSRKKKTSIVKNLIVKKSDLEKRLREVEVKMVDISKSGSTFKNDDFKDFLTTRDNLSYKISCVEKQMYLIKKTGKINGDFIESKLPTEMM